MHPGASLSDRYEIYVGNEVQATAETEAGALMTYQQYRNDYPRSTVRVFDTNTLQELALEEE